MGNTPVHVCDVKDPLFCKAGQKKITHIHPAVVVNIFQNPSNVERRKLKTGDMRNLLSPTILSALTVLLSVTTVTGEIFNF